MTNTVGKTSSLFLLNRGTPVMFHNSFEIYLLPSGSEYLTTSACIECCSFVMKACSCHWLSRVLIEVFEEVSFTNDCLLRHIGGKKSIGKRSAFSDILFAE